ncbi:MAG TPA: hypothetical protein VEJ84_01480 [Acidimicrobiales bacterium]|nr:hypothetical protein [Acidimicrobiales bacterium]
MSPDDRSDDTTVVMSVASRSLRRALRPLAWAILEDVALDAVAEDGRLVARTSVRQVAERLGVDPGTAARAFRTLRERGLLVLEREKSPAGRFGLSVYAIGTTPGLTVIPPRTDLPCAVSPFVVSPLTVLPSAVQPRMDRPQMCAPNKDFSGMDETVEPERKRMRCPVLRWRTLSRSAQARRRSIWAEGSCEHRQVCLPGGVASVTAFNRSTASLVLTLASVD